MSKRRTTIASSDAALAIPTLQSSAATAQTKRNGYSLSAIILGTAAVIISHNLPLPTAHNDNTPQHPPKSPAPITAHNDNAPQPPPKSPARIGAGREPQSLFCQQPPENFLERRSTQRREIDPPHIELAEPPVRRVETADGGGRSGADNEQPAGIAARHGQQAIADLGRGPARCSREPIEIIDQQHAIKRCLDTVTVLHQCIRPLIGACAPGHHGYQRACVLISCQASTGPNGSPVFACAGKTGPPSRLILSQTSAGNRIRCYVIAAPWVQFLCSCHEAVPPSRPAIDLRRRAQGPSSLAVALTSPPAQRFQARLDGTEHGATLKQVGAPSRLSCCIRSCAPC